MQSDRVLVDLARSGDLEALERLIARHTPRLYRVVSRITADQDEAEGIVQEAWLKAWQALPTLEADRPLFPWLVRVAVNAARDAWRKRRPLDFSDLGEGALEAEDDAPLPEEQVIDREMLARLAALVRRLREAERAVIALRYDGGLTYSEIGQALGIPVNTVRTHLHRAKARLRAWMREQDEGLAG